MSIKQATVADVIVEWDDTKHPQLNVQSGPLAKAALPRSANNDDEFTPSRIVINLKLDLGNAEVATVTLQNVHIKIPCSGGSPEVGWWNGAKWVLFKQMVYANGIADVTLPSPWPTDPPVGCNP
ncbi:MAG TPA: hypothetical protein VLG46_00355 [Anaerolineae bacterium]|nr:hypothetical protein [Anaerolineae bacterium]